MAPAPKHDLRSSRPSGSHPDADIAADAMVEACVRLVPDAVLVSSADGVVTRANREAERLFGYGPHELVGVSVDRLIPDELRSARRRASAGAESPRRLGREGQRLRAVRKDSTTFFAEIALGYLETPSGEVYIATVRDVTARCEIEDQVLRAQRHGVVGQLAGAIAHDFNNLVQVIGTSAECALSQLGPADPARREVEMIRGAGVRAGSLIRRLLAFIGHRVQSEPLDVSAVVLALEPLLQRLMGPAIRVDVRCDPGVASVHAEPTQIEQLILNLAANARDAMPSGGLLTIRVTMAAPGPADRLAAGEAVELTVTDTGVGMSLDIQGRMFEPFFTTKAHGKGTGLGLATVQTIVSHWGGEISCDSLPGRGTTFTVRLPAIESEARSPETADRQEPDEPGRGTETILVIDDEEFLRLTVTRILEQRGYRVLTAGSGDEALQLVDSMEGPLDLVVSDILMPGMSGWEAVARIRERRDVRALFTSGCPEEMSHDAADHQADEPFLAKPFSGASLARKIRETLSSVA